MEKILGILCFLQLEDLFQINHNYLKTFKKRKNSAFFLFQKSDNYYMKKYLLVVILVVVLIIGIVLIPEKEIKYDYLRLHIRANSNSVIDQDIKYKIKDEMVEFLSPHLSNVKSKEDAIKVINNYSMAVESICIDLLNKEGFNYAVNVKIANEYFPTRTYSNTTLESGYYDAVIIELGEAKGDNWWCVMYPPLCFVNKNENTNQIKYKSIICEWFNKLFK